MSMELAFIGWGLLCFIMGVAVCNLAAAQQDEPEDEEEDFDFWIDD